MTTIEFLAYLRSLDVRVFVEGDRETPPENRRLRCTAPEGILTDELKTQLAAHKTELIALLQHTTTSTEPLSTSIKPVVRGQFSPLSFAQQRLWFLSQLVPDSPFYNVPAAVRLSGNLNRVALEQSINEIVRRHEVLRTSFTQVNGQPTQAIAPHVNVSLPVTDLQALPMNEREAIAQQLITEEAQRPFDLTSGSLLRFKLLQLEPAEAVLLLTLHHIVSDGWSLGVLIRELGTLYTSLVEKTPATLPELPIQYADFAHWQREWLQGDVLENQLSYWRQQLQDLPTLNLPNDYAQRSRDGSSRPTVQSYRGAIEPVQLSSRLTKELEILSRQEGVSLFMTLLAAFQTLLHRYTGQDDIMVGSPIANRNYSELESLIGFFVNSLVLRTDVSGNPTFRELLGRVRDVALGAYAHQDLPFETLVEALEPDRTLSHNPLFQVVFALQNAPMQQLELPGLVLTPMSFNPGTTRFDLEFHLWECAQGLSGLWQAQADGLSGFIAYSTDLFDRTTISRLLGHFQTLLEGIVANPDVRLADLPILTAAERQQLLVEWNNTRENYEFALSNSPLQVSTQFLASQSTSETTQKQQFFCIHHLFEAHAKQQPDAIAVVFENEQLTYQQLNQRANQLAHQLQQLGVRPDTLVGLCVDRSLDMVVGILGILKAGGAYVPLDADYPSDRLQFMLADAQPPILVTQSWLSQKLPKTQTQLIYLDGDQHWKKPANLHASHAEVTPKNLAYVIYTSGSTGTPKGVLIEHRGLCNVAKAQIQTFHLRQESRILQFSSLSFDASIFEMLMAFGSGNTLYIIPSNARILGTALNQFLRDRAITHAILPPAVLALLPPDDLPALQTVIAGGEACFSDIVDRWAVDRRFFNAYGPTETTIWATVAQLTPNSGKPTIGRPIANTQTYILDSSLQPVPIGVTGELYISGDGLARGYLNRPDLTAQKFLKAEGERMKAEGGRRKAEAERPTILSSPSSPPPLSSPPPSSFLSPPSSLLYRTGDLARYHADGKIEFLGRIDDQVKIRSFRVELGEVESVLKQHPAIQDAVALAVPFAQNNPQKNTSVDKQLVAYFTVNVQNELKTLATNQHLQTQQIEQWKTLYDQTYQHDSADPIFNIIGWNSSYTGQPIPVEQMHEWVSDRVEQILALNPKRVLEIGCGTGLLLFKIAPHCAQYCATDFSSVSLDRIRQQLAALNLLHVELLQKMANDFENIDQDAFDVVILNSVIQYFPTLDYLLDVLEGAIKATAPGGVIFVGDVRNLSLLTAFHTLVQLHQADSALERSQLHQRVQQAMFEDPELVIDSEFFYTLRDRFPQVHHVQIQLIRGHSQNEMTQFRYNVVLHIGSSKTAAQDEQTLISLLSTNQWQWDGDRLTVSAIRQHLLTHQPQLFSITKVPNARVIAAVKAAELLSDADAPKTAGRIREAMEELPEVAIDPQDWWNLEAELPYTVEISWSRSSAEGHYDVLFIRGETNEQPTQLSAQKTTVAQLAQLPLDRPYAHSDQAYANQPLQAQFARQLIPSLRTYLEQKLPAYAIPSAFIALEKFPLTTNGKIDRRALPAPHEARRGFTETYTAPRSPLEETLSSIWTELLNLKQVSIHDNFFELGGHSLLATQMTSRMRDILGLEVALRSVFEAPTIAQLASVIETLQASHAQTQGPAIVKLDRESRRRLRSSLK